MVRDLTNLPQQGEMVEFCREPTFEFAPAGPLPGHGVSKQLEKPRTYIHV